MKAHVKLRNCPYCNRFPNMSLGIPDGPEPWLWKVYCNTESCLMHPETKKVAVRNTKKKTVSGIVEKLQTLAEIWNYGYEGEFEAMKEIDLTKILGEENVKREMDSRRNTETRSIAQRIRDSIGQENTREETQDSGIKRWPFR